MISLRKYIETGILLPGEVAKVFDVSIEAVGRWMTKPELMPPYALLTLRSIERGSVVWKGKLPPSQTIVDRLGVSRATAKNWRKQSDVPKAALLALMGSYEQPDDGLTYDQKQCLKQLAARRFYSYRMYWRSREGDKFLHKRVQPLIDGGYVEFVARQLMVTKKGEIEVANTLRKER